MRITTSLLALTLLVITSAIQVRADIARPSPAPSPAIAPKHVMNSALQIVPDSKTYGARLQISQDTWNQLREEMNAGTTGQSFTGRIASSSTNTIIAGLFMFLSVSFAGVWLARSANISNRNQKAAVAVLLGFVMLGAAAIITNANAGPPPAYLYRNLSKNLTAGKPTNGRVDIEIVPDGVGVKLIIPTSEALRTADD
jgi:hypothetical protein